MKGVMLIFLLISICCGSTTAQNCDSSMVIQRLILPGDTDSNIPWEPRHHVYINPDCSPKNVLLVHLPGTGDNPSSTTYFPIVAANNGYHAIVLKYKNNNGSAFTACNGSSDPDCYLKFRKETLEGIDYSTDVDVDSSNSIYNRIEKLLVYLELNFPTENWGQYLNGSAIVWNKIILSGHSQGGGHAPVAGIDNSIKRILMFAAPNDASTFFNAPANWSTAVHSTPDSCYYGFMHQGDSTIGKVHTQYAIWNNLGLGAFGDTVNVDGTSAPYSLSRELTTSIPVSWNLGLGPHIAMLLDNNTPLDGNGQPVFQPVWEYMLGVNALVGLIESKEKTNVSIYPNPSEGVLQIGANGLDRLKIYSVGGEHVFDRKFISQSNEHSINIEHLESGMYLVEFLFSNGQAQVKKIHLR